MRYTPHMSWIREHRIPLALCLLAALLALLPVFNIWRVLGAQWQGVIPSYGDEILYYNQIHEIADGHFWYGNQYLMEHAGGPPSVIFAGHWLAALPLLLGAPFVPAMYFNNVLWGVIFALLGYVLLRGLFLSKIRSAAGSLFAYLSCYGLMLRPSSRQEVYPFFLLFYIALIRLLKYPERRSSVIFLGLATGATFYVFSYLWQTVVITLGLAALYALYMRAWQLLRSILLASALGGAIGLPSLLYMLYLSKTYPYFLESISRFGLVNTHLPMAEVVYSGGWIGVLLALIAFVYWRVPPLREDNRFLFISIFAAFTGLGLWIMQGSNLITGKLLETGEHIRPFIGPWLALVLLTVGSYFFERRKYFSRSTGVVVCLFLLVLALGSLIFIKQNFYPYLSVENNANAWRQEQGYAAPLRWIDAQQKDPVVIWTAPNGELGLYVPTLSRDYVLYAGGALWTLTSNQEIYERYLTASYFDHPSTQYLKENFSEYMGRQDVYHRAKTIERSIKLCRILYFFDASHDCGAPPTSLELIGEPFFAELERKFTQDIQPNIKAYLQKYHVSYILKDTVRNPLWNPQSLGARLVWSDERYEVYKL